MGKCFEFDEKVIAVGLEVRDREDALRQMSQMLYKAGYVRDTYSEAIIRRERSFPTGLPTGENGVAIPHTDICHVIAPMIAVGIFKTPVEFQNMGDIEEAIHVKIIFMLAMNHCDNQVKLLSELMQIIQDQSLLNQLCITQSVTDISRLLKDKIHF
ncbi:PTS sugar transporter subunit IIA [Pelosinus propionicus]|uniref:PTS system IIA component, Gat family n=1 Tax=Pelosinus propionicus DSM 13327 TaxID=1123291 RepID=A0A1I4I0S6_9FIRM|nr:PTS sugar transporter subunit IIA [Pelosinus propionicus]SFL47959.1 PTS system IIA component, Gat family [Pelosinus propionicus DSM 13327]